MTTAMNKFYAMMYKRRGKPHYPENIAKVEHEKLLNSALQVHPLSKKCEFPSKKKNTEFFAVQKRRGENTKSAKKYQLFLDGYQEPFGKQNYEQSAPLKGNLNNTPKEEQLFNSSLTVNSKSFYPRHEAQNLLSQYSFNLNLDFFEKKTATNLEPEIQNRKNVESFPHESSTQHKTNFSIKEKTNPYADNIMKELEIADRDIDAFNLQLKAIRKILKDREKEINYVMANRRISSKFLPKVYVPDNNEISEDEVQSSVDIKKIDSLNKQTRQNKAVTFNLSNIRKTNHDKSKIHYKTVQEALFQNQDKPLQVLYENEFYKNKDSIRKIDVIDSSTNIDHNEDNRSNVLDNEISYENKNEETLKSMTIENEKSLENNYEEKSVTKSHSPRTQDIPSRANRVVRMPEQVNPSHVRKHLNNNVPNTAQNQVPVNLKFTDSFPARVLHQSQVSLTEDGKCYASDYTAISNRKQFSSLNRIRSPRKNTSPFCNQEILFTTEELPKSIRNSEFLKRELSKCSDINTEGFMSPKLLRKIQKARNYAREEMRSSNNENRMLKSLPSKNDSRLYSDFSSALKNTVFEPDPV